jgi:hypothetical protein
MGDWSFTRRVVNISILLILASQRDLPPLKLRPSRVHPPQLPIARPNIRMEHHASPRISSYIRTARSNQVWPIARRQKRPRCPRVRACDISCRRVLNVIMRGGVAVTAKEEEVDPLGADVQRGRFYEWAVRVDAVQDRDGVADGSYAIFLDLLEVPSTLYTTYRFPVEGSRKPSASMAPPIERGQAKGVEVDM